MSKLLHEVNQESEELRIIMEQVEQFIEQVPTLLEDAEELLGQVSAALKGGKSLANNPTIGKVLAGLKVLIDPTTRKQLAPEIKDIDNRFTIKDVIMKAGPDKAANQVLSRIATTWAQSEVTKFENMLKAIEEDPKKKEAFIQHLDKMRLDYSRLKGLIKKPV